MCDVQAFCLLCGGSLSERDETKCLKIGPMTCLEWVCKCGAVQRTHAEKMTDEHLAMIEMRTRDIATGP